MHTNQLINNPIHPQNPFNWSSTLSSPTNGRTNINNSIIGSNVGPSHVKLQNNIGN